MIIETQGCVTVQDDIINNGFINTRLIQNSQIELNVKDVNTYPNIEIDISENTIDVACGLVCGSSVGLPVLYASDGVLITIDGQYLIVRKGN